MIDREIIVTDDGSHTLYVPDLDEHYHSTHGAICESQHIYIDSGFKKAASLSGSIRIFEVGFGTGLNVLLTLLEAEKIKKPVCYTSIEAFPLKEDIWSALNYPVHLEKPGCTNVFSKIHEAGWGKSESISPYFTLQKIHGNLEDYIPGIGIFHLVYFDAFAPDVQPGMWTELIFRRIYDSMAPGGILVTYSVKGRVVRDLKGIGFKVEKLPGPQGKRHILMATKIK